MKYILVLESIAHQVADVLDAVYADNEVVNRSKDWESKKGDDFSSPLSNY